MLCSEFGIHFIAIGCLFIHFNIFILNCLKFVIHQIFLDICSHKNIHNYLVFLKEGIKVRIGTEMLKCCFRKFAVSCEIGFGLIFFLKHSSYLFYLSDT